MKKLLMVLLLVSPVAAQAETFTITLKAAEPAVYKAKVGDTVIATQTVLKDSSTAYVTPDGSVLRLSVGTSPSAPDTVDPNQAGTLYYTSSDCSGTSYGGAYVSGKPLVIAGVSPALYIPDLTQPRADITSNSNIYTRGGICQHGTQSVAGAYLVKSCTAATCGYDSSTSLTIVKE